MWLLRVLEHSPHILFDHSTAKESSSAPPRDSAPFQIIIRYQIKGSAFYDTVRLLTPLLMTISSDMGNIPRTMECDFELLQPVLPKRCDDADETEDRPRQQSFQWVQQD